ncbi:MAG TPA: hypothetical protein VLK58_18785, partial [Conexibacter sp.]|nr:hypothetical protein [Conexibacter sp.]
MPSTRGVAHERLKPVLSRRCLNARISRLSLLGAARAFIVLVALGTVVAMALTWPTNVGDKYQSQTRPLSHAGDGDL